MTEEQVTLLFEQVDNLTTQMDKLQTQTHRINWNEIYLKAILFVFIFVVGIIIIKLINHIVGKILDKNDFPLGYKHSLLSIISIVSFCIILIVSLSSVGIQTSALITVLLSIVLATIVGVKDSLSDIAAGILIIFLSPIRHDDYVYFIEKEDRLVRILEIRLFHTICLTPFNETVIIPNRDVISHSLINISKQPLVRAVVRVTVAHKADIDAVGETMKAAIRSVDGIVNPDGASVYFIGIVPEGIEMSGSVDVKPEDFTRLKGALTRAVAIALKENGVPFAEPRVRVVKEE